MFAGELDPPFHQEVSIELKVNDQVSYKGKAILNSEDTTTEIAGTNAVLIATGFQGTGALTKSVNV